MEWKSKVTQLDYDAKQKLKTATLFSGKVKIKVQFTRTICSPSFSAFPAMFIIFVLSDWPVSIIKALKSQLAYRMPTKTGKPRKIIFFL